MSVLTKLSSPQLKLVHSGKVRESFRIDPETRMIVVTDRISCFDRIMETPIPDKGAILNGIAGYWFESLKKVCPSHLRENIDPNISLVREARPIRVEMIVRGYLTGSAWREYGRGKRVFSGVTLPDGLRKNQKLDPPILTPTTKEKSDREITPTEITEQGLATRRVYEIMAANSLALFRGGTERLAERGVILVDTKYEFGLVGNDVILIDEIHTPDSSRFWYADSYSENPETVRALDKEYVRDWLLKNKVGDSIPTSLPPEVVTEARNRYEEIYRLITGSAYVPPRGSIRGRVLENLTRRKIIREGYVAIIMGSPADLPFARKIAETVSGYGLKADLRVVSAHKNGERIPEIAEEYNSSLEPGAVIAIAGRSNGLGGALAANLNIPVFNCPPFRDAGDQVVNINSSLVMPSRTPAATLLDPQNAAHAAMRSLNLPRLRDMFTAEISTMKADLEKADLKIRSNDSIPAPVSETDPDFVDPVPESLEGGKK